MIEITSSHYAPVRKQTRPTEESKSFHIRRNLRTFDVSVSVPSFVAKEAVKQVKILPRDLS